MSDSSTKPAVQDGLAFERPLNDLQTKIDELRSLNTGSQLELQGEIELLEDRLKRQTAEVYAGLSPWERVNVARHADRVGLRPRHAGEVERNLLLRHLWILEFC